MQLALCQFKDNKDHKQVWLANMTDGILVIPPNFYLGMGGLGTYVSVATTPMSDAMKSLLGDGHASRITNVTQLIQAMHS